MTYWHVYSADTGHQGKGVAHVTEHQESVALGVPWDGLIGRAPAFCWGPPPSFSPGDRQYGAETRLEWAGMTFICSNCGQVGVGLTVDWRMLPASPAPVSQGFAESGLCGAGFDWGSAVELGPGFMFGE